MIDHLPPLLFLLSASFCLGAAHYPVRARALAANRRPAAKAAGWLMLAGSLTLFAGSWGLEVGAAWFLLWLGLATMAATAWLSVRPAQVPWLAGLLAACGLAAWILPRIPALG
ncbi:MAG: DUF3325 family protein [Acidobacteriota bacterium]